MKTTFMDKFQEIMEKTLLPIGTKIASQRHLSAVKDGLAVLIPLTIIGGFAVLLAVPPIPSNVSEPTNFLLSFLFAWKGWANSIQPLLLAPYTLTIGCLSLYVVSSIAYRLAKHYELDGLNNLVSALLIFILVSGALDLSTGTLNVSLFGASYMFGAIMIALAVVEINKFFIDKNIVIKLPDTVPPNVAGPFNVLIPLIFNVIFFSVLNVLCVKVTGSGLTNIMFALFQPLIKATGSLPSVLIIIIIKSTFWFFGIHGDNMVGPIVTPITTAAVVANLEAYTAGQPLPYIFAGNITGVFGGWMSFLAIQFIMMRHCKSQQLSNLVKVSFIPSMFNINEPGVFGIPSVLNVYTFVPGLICALFNYIVYHVCASINLVGRVFMQLPFTTPGPLAAFLGTMDYRTLILWVILFIINYFIYLPFMKTYDKQLCKQEANNG